MDHINTLKGHTGIINCLLVTSSQLVSASNDSTMRVWDLKGPNIPVLQTITTDSESVKSLAITSACLACGTQNGKVHLFEQPNRGGLWDVSCQPVDAHTNTVWGLANLAGCMVTASADTTIKLWQPGTWTQTMNTLNVHQNEVLCVANTRTYLFSGDEKGMINIWAVAS